MTVFFAIPPERSGAANAESFNSLIDVALEAGRRGHKRQASIGYTRTDNARNLLCKAFAEAPGRHDDMLVMLDVDHLHPTDILDRFAAHDPSEGVVGALAYRRGEPYDPLFFIRDEAGALRSPASLDYGKTYKCAIVSTSAIAIRRWVFAELTQRGYAYPWFRYEYPTNGSQPSEDMYFGRICEQAGIWHYVDTGLIIPHAAQTWINREVHEAFLKANPRVIEEIKVAA